jgi:hypothetical protein
MIAPHKAGRRDMVSRLFMAVIAIIFFIIIVTPLRFAVSHSRLLPAGNINMRASTLLSR